METKECSKCKKEKLICDFGKDRTRKGGLSYLCKSCLIVKSKKYKEDNKEKVLESYSIYRKNNRERMKVIREIYKKNNKEKISEYRRYYSNKRRKESDLVRVMENVRRRTNHFFSYKNIRKKGSIFDILGCSLEEFVTHLENQFIEGMNWENHGKNGWHIDHIIPLSSAKTEEEIYKLCYYTNLQPLWAEDNLKKGKSFMIF
jgi:hypothetical protein